MENENSMNKNKIKKPDKPKRDEQVKIADQKNSESEETQSSGKEHRKSFEYDELVEGPYSVFITKVFVEETSKTKNYSDLDISRCPMT